MSLLQKGSRGDEVIKLQKNLVQMGWQLETDGIFGAGTETAVKELQTLFNYTVDGKVGDGTMALITQQLGYGWNRNAPDAKERAQKANPIGGKPATAKQPSPDTKGAAAKQQQPTAKK